MSEKKRKTIMLVDDNQTNLNIAKNMLKDSYEVYALPSAERLFKFLENVIPDLILLDIEMPGINGFDVIKILKSNTHYSHIPIIFVTAKSEESNELTGLTLGAVDYVKKPFSAAVLQKRVETHLLIESQKAELKHFNDNLVEIIKEKTTQIFELQYAIINTIAEIIEFRDAFTGEHIKRTQKYVGVLIDSLVENNIYPEEVLAWKNVEYIIPATQLHDFGKIFISDAILNKPGKLTFEEFEIIKTHVIKGVEAIKKMDAKGKEQTAFLKHAEIIAATHHEKWDGTGYPNGLKERDIPLKGRLMAIADVYDALTSARPYKAPFTPEKSSEIIIEGSGTAFDPVLVDVFRRVQEQFAAIAKDEDESDTPGIAPL